MDVGYHNVSFDDTSDGPLLETLAARAERLEEAGFRWFSVMDHLWQIPPNGRRDEPFFDCYTVLPAVAAVTDEIELSGLVTCTHYRNPGLLGKTLTTLDHLSQGRAVLGIGAGWFEEEYDAYGYEFPEPATRIGQLADTIRGIREMWTGESPVTYRGDHVQIEEAIVEPKPVQDPHPPILVGGGGEQLTLRVTAQEADRWNIPGTDTETYAHKLDVLKDHCETVGRDYDDIEKTVVNTVVVRETSEAAHDAYERLMADTARGPAPRDEYRGAVGTPEEVAAEIEAFGELGVSLFIMKVPKNDPESIDRFVDDVLPTI